MVRQKSVSPRELFRFYRLFYKSIKTIAEFRRIINLFYLFISTKVLDGYAVGFPYDLGALEVIAKKFRYGKDIFKISWALTAQYKKKIYCTNDATNGYKYRFIWNRSKFKKSKRPFDCYRFYAAYDLRKELYNKIMSGKEYFLKG